MRLIITHEQADFDALASMLGAYLLDDTAIPVLPRRMNRNVRAFVTLYGTEMPFIEARDLPAEPVECIYLVDTQSMATVRGVSETTPVYVVDHHARRPDLPPHWTISTEEVGATATIFAEQLREHNGGLSMAQATLLLLGIYEDTGSLTYSRTNVRDLRAASYLLEQGANLSIAADFLNHPLSLHQQALYDQLRAAAQSHIVHGYTVIIACGDAQDVDEELSTVAHRLRDWLDPDAIFVLVTTRGGVQLIGRSTTDHIDVAQVAAHFGGGGHSRAAACLIKGSDLPAVQAELVSVLPEHVHPAITVAQIMSHGPQVLAPETSAQSAAERMQRYGYEGYPVVKDGRVVGLLTRRAVDRAIAHKLNLTAASLMDSGQVTVLPDSSVEYLQRLMTDTGWGQVPVVHPQSGEIIGIVTRTDLLKTLTARLEHLGLLNLADRLEVAMPAARLALLKAAAGISSEQHAAMYIVGGFVRDLLLDRPGLDFDLVLEGDAIALGQVLCSRYGGRLTTHTRFGTAKWLIADIRPHLASALGCPGGAADLPEFLDIITARTEFYTHPTALPTVERGSIKLDLHRRDFTINTLALRLDGHHYGELHDHWGGLNDLRDGRVRVLHSISFIDDPTRMLRAVRFEQRFGFQIEGRTLELLREALSLIGRISGDRLRHELNHILDEEQRVPMLERLHNLGLLSAIHPCLPWDEWASARLGQLDGLVALGLDPTPGEIDPPAARQLAYCVWLLRLPPEELRSVVSRLRISAVHARELEAACRLWQSLPTLLDASPSQAVALLDEIPLTAIYANCLAAQDERLCAVLQAYLTDWRTRMPTITGHDLLARGMSPGPEYRRILGALRGAWLDGKITTIEQERTLLENLISDSHGDH